MIFQRNLIYYNIVLEECGLGGTFSLFKIEFGEEERAGAKVVSTTCEISLATHRQCNSKMTRASRKQHDQTDTEGKRFGVFTEL